MFKDKKILALLLLVVIVAFSLLSEYNISSMLMRKVNSREGYTEPNVPSCDSHTLGSSPDCHPSLLDSAGDYSAEWLNSDNYISKTEIVPPVCPACPTLIDGHVHEKMYNEETGENTPILGQGSNINMINQSQSSLNQEEITNTENVTNTNIYNTTNEAQPDETDTANNNSNNNNNNSVNEIIPSQDAKQSEIDRLKEEIRVLKESKNGTKDDDSCPPCPPCARCPEPSFSCEKVLNYRSPNVGNYLPLPVLNDFSTFDNAQ
jgi:hypothetical protein